MFADGSLSTMFQMPQVAIVMGCLIPIAGIGFYYWYMAQKAHADSRLKRTMIERGMSAEEIERVLSAKSPNSDDGIPK